MDTVTQAYYVSGPLLISHPSSNPIWDFLFLKKWEFCQLPKEALVQLPVVVVLVHFLPLMT